MKSGFDTPQQIFNRLHEFVKRYDANGQADLFAEQGIWEFPFATGNIPKKIEGRENIRTFGKMGMEASKKAGRQITGYNAVTVHQTQDLHTIIVEFELEGENLSENSKYKIPYIQLLRVEDGQIVLLRDYFSMEILKNVMNIK
jgi:uncharacterized protein